MGFTLTKKDLARLKGVHPDLVRVVKTAAETSALRFFVVQGVRSIAEQKQNLARGKSQTMKSRHLDGHAVDLAVLTGDGQITWSWHYYLELDGIMQRAAAQCKVPIEWGGAWKTIKDGDHWQLPWSSYPSS